MHMDNNKIQSQNIDKNMLVIETDYYGRSGLVIIHI